MWQVLLAAAIAGSTGFAAKRFFFNPFSTLSENSQDHDEVEVQESVTHPVGIGFLESPYYKTDGVFRFSSGETAGSGPRKSSRVKSRVRVRGLKKKKKGFRGGEIEKGSGNGAVDVWSKRKSSKMPRTGQKNIAAASASKCFSCSTDQESSLFRCGIGVGIMCMISAGKSEISKLNAAMEETAKVVLELKDELSRRKSLHNTQIPGSAYGLNVDSMETSGKCRGSHGLEYASSVLTEELEPEPKPEQEVEEMDQLQIELESELRKLSFTEPDEPVEGSSGLTDRSESYQCGGVLASELDKRLSHLLIEQQEGQIGDLEAELQIVQSKLQHKEAELRSLKDCVRRLTDFSLSTSLGDEPEPNPEQELPNTWNQQNHTDHEPRKPVVGMKRPTESSFYVQETYL